VKLYRDDETKASSYEGQCIPAGYCHTNAHYGRIVWRTTTTSGRKPNMGRGVFPGGGSSSRYSFALPVNCSVHFNSNLLESTAKSTSAFSPAWSDLGTALPASVTTANLVVLGQTVFGTWLQWYSAKVWPSPPAFQGHSRLSEPTRIDHLPTTSY